MAMPGQKWDNFVGVGERELIRTGKLQKSKILVSVIRNAL